MSTLASLDLTQEFSSEDTLSFLGVDVVLVEDDDRQIQVARETLKNSGFNVLVCDNIRLAELLAKAGARFFILDIRIDSTGLELAGGLSVLESLRRGFGSAIFAAVLTEHVGQYKPQILEQRPDLFLEKGTDIMDDYQTIAKEYGVWNAKVQLPVHLRSGAPQESEAEEHSAEFARLGVNNLCPSNRLALQLLQIDNAELAKTVAQRRTIAAALGEERPTLASIKAEIGERMREEVRGALRHVALEALQRGESTVALSQDGLFETSFARKILVFLPVAYGGDDFLYNLFNEFMFGAGIEIMGDWGVVRTSRGDLVLLVPEKSDG